MTRSADGHWAAAVASVRPGDGYVFRLDNATERIDPRCPDIAIDSSHSIVPPPYTFTHDRVSVPAERAVYYELLVGRFTPEGTFAAAAERLGYLHALGVTVVELMPVAHSCGSAREWGYCPRAPLAVRPELGGSVGLKRFVDAAAGYGMAVAVDVVFNPWVTARVGREDEFKRQVLDLAAASDVFAQR